LYDFAPVGYFTFDKNGLILEVNLTGAGQLGVERNYLLNKPFSSFIFRDDRDVFHTHRTDVLENRPRQTCEIRLTRKDGSLFYARLDSSAGENSEANVVFCRTTLTDITRHIEAAKELRKAYEEMELHVKERTAELLSANEKLKQEIEDRKQAANSLREALAIIKQLKDQLYEENIYLKEEINLIHSHKDIVGNSDAIRSVLQQIEQVAPTDSTVLIQGRQAQGKN